MSDHQYCEWVVITEQLVHCLGHVGILVRLFDVLKLEIVLLPLGVKAGQSLICIF